jgi:predicted outer membrane lipoprotein
MTQLWTIIFGTLLAIAFGLTAWHDHEVEKIRKRREAAFKQREQREE